MRKSNKMSLLHGWNYAPNIVTYARILLAIVFIFLYVISGSYGFNSLASRWGAFILFVVAASSDKLDGWMARKYNQVTELGKLLDPIADKLLMLGALIIAAMFSEILWIVTVLFVIREIGITLLRFIVIAKGGKVIAASSLGKYKTVAQSIGISMVVFPVSRLAVTKDYTLPSWVLVYYFIAYSLLWAALVLALYSGYGYCKAAFATLRTIRKGYGTVSNSEVADTPTSAGGVPDSEGSTDTANNGAVNNNAFNEGVNNR